MNKTGHLEMVIWAGLKLVELVIYWVATLVKHSKAN